MNPFIPYFSQFLLGVTVVYLLLYFTRVPFPDLHPLDADTQNILYFYDTFQWKKSL